MKKLLLPTALLLLFMLPHEASAKHIICTTYPLWLLTGEIAGSVKSNKIMLLTPFDSGCAHDYTPSPRDLRKAAHADAILICHNTDLDKHLVNSALKVNKKLPAAVVDNIRKNRDIHTFASPDTAKELVLAIASALVKADPDNKLIYQKQSQRLAAELDKLISKAKKLAADPPVAIIQSPVFSNLMNLVQWETILLKKEKSAIPSPAELRKVLLNARIKNAAVIIAEEKSNDRIVRTAAAENKLPAVELDMLVSGPEAPPEDYYVKIMESNLNKLRKIKKL